MAWCVRYGCYLQQTKTFDFVVIFILPHEQAIIRISWHFSSVSSKYACHWLQVLLEQNKTSMHTRLVKVYVALCITIWIWMLLKTNKPWKWTSKLKYLSGLYTLFNLAPHLNSSFFIHLTSAFQFFISKLSPLLQRLDCWQLSLVKGEAVEASVTFPWHRGPSRNFLLWIWSMLINCWSFVYSKVLDWPYLLSILNKPLKNLNSAWIKYEKLIFCQDKEHTLSLEPVLVSAAVADASDRQRSAWLCPSPPMRHSTQIVDPGTF